MSQYIRARAELTAEAEGSLLAAALGAIADALGVAVSCLLAIIATGREAEPYRPSLEPVLLAARPRAGTGGRPVSPIGIPQGMAADLRRRALALMVASTLQKAGYRVSAALLQNGLALRAYRGDQLLTVAVRGANQLEMDMAGFQDFQCFQELDRLVTMLEKRGLRLAQRQAIVHGRRRGGDLVASLGRLPAESWRQPAEVLAAGLDALRSQLGHVDRKEVARRLALRRQTARERP
jgi:hypothetical protein